MEFPLQKIIKIFNPDLNRNTLIKAEEKGQIPEAGRHKTGSINRRAWSIEDLPEIGEKYGFLKKFSRPVCATVFVTKGGVLKTTLTLNIARLAALHNIKTCIVGLDMQADITHAFGIGTPDEDSYESLEEVDADEADFPTLYDFYRGNVSLDECIVDTDIPTLSIIPESSELVGLEAIMQSEINRELWLKENVVKPLLNDFDLVLIDSPPSWNLLVSNALVASDVLISPVECKINHYRNVKHFTEFVEMFKKKAKIDFKHIFIPTKLVAKRKLATDIRHYYVSTLPNCIAGVIKETTAGEESMANAVSLPEFAPGKPQADEMKDVITEVWRHIEEASKAHTLDYPSKEYTHPNYEAHL